MWIYDNSDDMMQLVLYRQILFLNVWHEMWIYDNSDDMIQLVQLTDVVSECVAWNVDLW